MNKMEIIKKLEKLEDELQEVSLAVCELLVDNPNDEQIDYADNKLDNAFDNLVGAVCNLKKSNVK